MSVSKHLRMPARAQLPSERSPRLLNFSATVLLWLSIAMLVVIAWVIASISPSRAQNNPVLNQTRTYGVFTPTARAPNSTVSNVSSRVALGAAGPVVWTCNTGSVDAYIKLGGASVTASTSADTLVRAGMCAQLDAAAATYLASITASGSTTLVTSIGAGSIAAGGSPPSSGGSSAVTVADGADTAEGATADSACATDNGTCSVTALLKRIAQRVTSLITALGSPLQAGGTVGLSSQYPAGAAAVTNSNTGTTGATTATLPGVSAKTTYVCGFTITSDATAALAGTATVTGTISGTMSYIQNVGGATAAGILTQSFSPCVPASAVNTGIAVNSVAAGTGGNTAVVAWGYQL